jgi:hypothetical protein
MTIRRMKTYTGEQGYVYQYYFVGQRPATLATGPSVEYVFDITSDRKTTYAVSLFLPASATDAWACAHGRALRDAEKYGAVKMRLFRAFDEIEDMQHHGRHLEILSSELEQLLQMLKVE